MERLLTEDAPFHVGRKVPDLEIGVLHSACASRPGNPAPEIFYKITRYLVKVKVSIQSNKKVESQRHFFVAFNGSNYCPGGKKKFMHAVKMQNKF
jgi:hypothetical protein